MSVSTSSGGTSGGQKKILVGIAVLVVGAGCAMAAYLLMTGEKPVPTASQTGADKLKAEMQKAESDAKAKAPPPEISSESEPPATRGARKPK